MAKYAIGIDFGTLSGRAVLADIENGRVISSATSSHPDLVCLNWKAEIDALIQTGIDKWEFCRDDEHKHSTALAGYVGAHMIYRALYGTPPFGPMWDAIDQQYAEDMLGSYVETGYIKQMDTSQILYFNEYFGES